MNEDTAKIRILVVDDDIAVVEMLDTLLTSEGFEVRTLTEPAGTLGTVADWQPHVVILDIMMPGLDGRDLARQIRDRNDVPDGIGIVFHSALTSDDDTWEAWQAGADSYITKPSQPDQVFGEVLRVLEARLEQGVELTQTIPTDPSATDASDPSDPT